MVHVQDELFQQVARRVLAVTLLVAASALLIVVEVGERAQILILELVSRHL